MYTTPELFTMNDKVPSVKPESRWVLQGLGSAAPWRDGRTVRVEPDGDTWIEHLIKPGAKTPKTFTEIGQTPQGRVGWIRLNHATTTVRKAASRAGDAYLETGRYELVGPGINRNPHKLANPTFYRHNGPLDGSDRAAFGIPNFPRNYYALVAWLETHDYAGILWFHHHDPTVTAKFTR